MVWSIIIIVYTFCRPKQMTQRRASAKKAVHGQINHIEALAKGEKFHEWCRQSGFVPRSSRASFHRSVASAAGCMTRSIEAGSIMVVSLVKSQAVAKLTVAGDAQGSSAHGAIRLAWCSHNISRTIFDVPWQPIQHCEPQ